MFDIDCIVVYCVVLVLLEMLIGELEVVDVVLIFMLVYNYMVFLVLKVWIDLVVWFECMFCCMFMGKVGMLIDCLVLVVFVFGGNFDGVYVQIDFLMLYLCYVFVMVGICQVEGICLQNMVCGVDFVMWILEGF